MYDVKGRQETNVKGHTSALKGKLDRQQAGANVSK